MSREVSALCSSILSKKYEEMELLIKELRKCDKSIITTLQDNHIVQFLIDNYEEHKDGENLIKLFDFFLINDSVDALVNEGYVKSIPLLLKTTNGPDAGDSSERIKRLLMALTMSCQSKAFIQQFKDNEILELVMNTVQQSFKDYYQFSSDLFHMLLQSEMLSQGEIDKIELFYISAIQQSKSTDVLVDSLYNFSYFVTLMYFKLSTVDTNVIDKIHKLKKHKNRRLSRLAMNLSCLYY